MCPFQNFFLRGLSLEHVVILGSFLVTIVAFSIVFIGLIGVSPFKSSSGARLEVSSVNGVFYDDLLYRIDVFFESPGVLRGKVLVNLSIAGSTYSYSIEPSSVCYYGAERVLGGISLDSLISARLVDVEGGEVSAVVYTDSLGVGHLVLGGIESPLIDFSGRGACRESYSGLSQAHSVPLCCLAGLLALGDASDRISVGGIVFERGVFYRVVGSPLVFIVVSNGGEDRLAVILPGVKDPRGIVVSVGANDAKTIIRITGVASRVSTGTGVLLYEQRS